MGALIVKGDVNNPIVSTFFDVNGVVVVEAKRKDVNGQCTKKDNECKGREIRDSRWNDMKASMYLLGNAFRTDQQKPPDRLRTFCCLLCYSNMISLLFRHEKKSIISHIECSLSYLYSNHTHTYTKIHIIIPKRRKQNKKKQRRSKRHVPSSKILTRWKRLSNRHLGIRKFRTPMLK